MITQTGSVVKKKIFSVLILILLVTTGILTKKIFFPAVPELPSVWQKTEPTGNRDYFVFVIDHSASISQTEMQHVIRGFQRMIQEMPARSSAAIVIFGNMVEHIHPMTRDHGDLMNQLKGIRPDGESAMNDGIARALSILTQHNGRRAVFYFTDGPDNNSGYSLDQIQKMAITEGISVYGVGIGEMSRERLMAFSKATGGFFGTTKTYASLGKILPYVMQQHMEGVEKKRDVVGEALIRSFPDNIPVSVNEIPSGNTPVRIELLPEGRHTIRAFFQKNTPKEYTVEIKAGHTTRIDLRETGSGRNMILSSIPASGTVFIDGVYIGQTGPFNKEFARENWKSAISITAEKELLTARNIPLGSHEVTLPCLPELNSGLGLDLNTRLQIKLDRSPEAAVLVTSLMGSRVLLSNIKEVTDLSAKH